MEEFDVLVLETAMLSLGIIVGVYFADAMKPWMAVVCVLFAVTVLPSVYLGLSSLRSATSDGSNER